MGVGCNGVLEVLGPDGWEYRHRFSLCKNYDVFAEIGLGICRGVYATPLYPCRGLPDDLSEESKEQLDMECYNASGHSWLTESELKEIAAKIGYDFYTSDVDAPENKEWRIVFEFDF